MTEEISAVFRDARAIWGVFQNRLARLPDSGDPATSVTRDAWAVPFLGLLGFELRYNPRAYDVGGLSFAVSHRAGEAEDAPPVHIVGAGQDLGRLAASGRPRLAPHSLLQEFLNRTEHIWGVVTNGRILRLLRNSSFIRRQAYVEFDLQAMFDEQRFLDFCVLYRLLHRTRFPVGMADGSGCLLETYYAHAVEQGGRVREHLRDGVAECIKILADGFLSHPSNESLREEVKSGRLTAQNLYAQLLRHIYRFLFLLVAEDRGLVSPAPLYRKHYGVGRLRLLVEKRSAFTAHGDLWEGLRVLWKAFADEQFASLLSLAPLNGELFAPLDLDDGALSNRDLLAGFWHLANYRESPSAPARRVNYSALDVEEMGSVYESLLDCHPLIQTDASGRMSFELAAGSERKTTGSYYTPPELVNELVQSALVPVLGERLKAAPSPKDKEKAVLSLKVCDPACGSGHFLLAAARHLGKELARLRTSEDEPPPERVRECVRDVISHCLYGVDKNPLAVDLCRVALWIEGHTEGKPLTFLDHRIRCGDSLVGVFDLETLKKGIPEEAFKPLAGDDKDAARAALKQNRYETREGPRLFGWEAAEGLKEIRGRGGELEAIADDTPEQIRRKKAAYEAQHRNPIWRRDKAACDLRTAAFFQKHVTGRPPITSASVADVLDGRPIDGRLTAEAEAFSMRQGFFHWPLEFPEVFAEGGFDVVIGNPPFLGGLKIGNAFGEKYRSFLIHSFRPFINRADLCATFFRLAFSLIKRNGLFGMVSTNSIGQGDTRESGLEVILSQGGYIHFAHRFIKWPGTANVEVNLVAVNRGYYDLKPMLDGKDVFSISSRLNEEIEKTPNSLSMNEGKAFIGDYVRGIGFILSRDEATRSIDKAERNSECLFPYLSGEDLNTHPEQMPSRFAICFHDWKIEKTKQYPDLLKIIEERVKPERMRVKQIRDRENWWRYNSYRKELRKAIVPLRRVLVRSEVSEFHMISFVPKDWVFSHMIIVFAFDDNYHFSLLQSNLHEAWVWRFASSLESRNRYTPTDCFSTFPFPQHPTMEAKYQTEVIGSTYHEYRKCFLLDRRIGLTQSYNLFNNPIYMDADIVRLRKLHVDMDQTILDCYHWKEVDLGHNFYKNERGQIRYTVSPNARREILNRLLMLNLEIDKQN